MNCCCFEDNYPQMNNCYSCCYQISPNCIRENYCNNSRFGNDINNKMDSYDEEMNLLEFNMKVDVLNNKINQINNEFSNINLSSLSQQNEKFKQKINSYNYCDENDKTYLTYQFNENNNNISHNNSNINNAVPIKNNNKGEINNLNLSANNINNKKIQLIEIEISVTILILKEIIQIIIC